MMIYSLARQLALAALAISPAILFSQSAAITIDENYSDWTPGLATFTDGVDNPGGIDLLDFQATNDDDFLYIKFTMDTELDVTDNIIPHTLWLYIDADDDENTGFITQTGYGTELGINFRQKYAWFNTPEPNVQVSFSDIQLRILPTVSSATFEMAIGRSVQPDGVNDLFTNPVIRILLKETNDGDEMPDVGTVFTYTFDETPVAPMVPVDLDKSNPAFVRVLAYNTLQDGFNDAGRVDNFETLITLIDPDVIGLSEASGTSIATVKSLLDTWMPLGTVDGWYVIKDDWDLITASRWDFISTWDLDRQFSVLIDLPATYSTDFLFTNSHLNCCAADATRQAQADEYAAFILDAKSVGGMIDLPANTPFVYGGDLNLVGFSQQLTTLITGDIQDTGTWGTGGALDWDGTDLTDPPAIQSDKRMAYTWRDDGGTYPPGRLDFQIYSDAVMTLEKMYSLQTEIMSPARLALYGLSASDSQDASDHFPVVVDYSIGNLIVDSDGDGIEDSIDNCPDDPNALQENADGDLHGNVCDNCPNSVNDGQEDDDGDSVGNVCDNCPNDPNKTEPGQCGCGNSDVDSDNDGVADCNDNCPLDPNKTEPGQCNCGTPDDDSDSDGVADCNDNCPNDPNKTEPGDCGCGVVDFDSDGDTHADCVDNCPSDSNLGQEDWNSDGIGDACQDSDGDSLGDEAEILTYGTDPDDADTDEDGLLDGEEVNLYATNPLMQDSDGDGLTDSLEISIGLNPLTNDSNGDGCTDDLEFSNQCPGSPNCDCQADFNGDTFVDTSDLLDFLSFFGLPCN